jgi:hypothetical protein
MSGTRRDILIPSLAMASIFAVSRAADGHTAKGSQTDPTLSGVGSDYAKPVPGGVYGRCVYFTADVDEAFATCPMFIRTTK